MVNEIIFFCFDLSSILRSFVRLGEHDLSTDTETRHVDFKIAKVRLSLGFDLIYII